MSFLKRNHPPDELDTDDENDDTIDPELRLRTVRTAASAIAESIQSEQRAQRRRFARKHHSRFFRSKPVKRKQETLAESTQSVKIRGRRRNIYVNFPLSAMEVDHRGEPLVRFVRNKVRTSSELCLGRSTRSTAQSILSVEYTILTFIPKNLYEQFRRCVYP